MMSQNREFLNFIYQNAEMGRTTIPKLLEKVDDEGFRSLLHEQLQEYQAVGEEAGRLIQEDGGEPKEIGTMQKMGADMMLQMQTLVDDSSSHVAEMMMKGSNMGIIEITKHLHQYPEADRKVVHLANDLLRIEQRNLDELKQYLQ